MPNSAVYSATKGAVDALTRSLAVDLGPRRIRVNAINPGVVETEGTRAGGFTGGDFQKQIEAQTPLGRIAQPQDIAPAVVFRPRPMPVGLPGRRSMSPADCADGRQP